jgi:hypothetical protein
VVQQLQIPAKLWFYIYIYINFDSTTFNQIPAKLYLLTFKLIRGDYKIQNIQDTLSPTAPNLETQQTQSLNLKQRKPNIKWYLLPTAKALSHFITHFSSWYSDVKTYHSCRSRLLYQSFSPHGITLTYTTHHTAYVNQFWHNIVPRVKPRDLKEHPSFLREQISCSVFHVNII